MAKQPEKPVWSGRRPGKAGPEPPSVPVRDGRTPPVRERCSSMQRGGEWGEQKVSTCTPSSASAGACTKEPTAGKDPQVLRDTGTHPWNLQAAANLYWPMLLERLVLMNFYPGVFLDWVVLNSAGGLLRHWVSFPSHFLEHVFESLKSKTSLSLCLNNTFEVVK